LYDIGAYRKSRMPWGLRRKLENLLPQTFGYPADGMMRSALPWAFPLDDDGVVLTKYGALQRTIRIRGIDDQSSNRQVQADFDARINNVLKRVGTGGNSGVALWIDADRHLAPPLQPTPREAWGTTASWVIDAERVDNFNGRGVHLETECHVTYCRMLPSDKAVRWQKILIENAEKTTVGSYREFLAQFKQETDGFALALRECGMPEAEPLTTDETLTYLHSCVSTRRHPVTMPDWSAPIDDMLADSDLTPGLVAKLGDRYV